MAVRSSEAQIGAVGGNTVVSTASFTRPADTTQYAASDAVTDSTSAPTVRTFSSCARKNAGSGYITKARLMKSTATTTNASFRLWVYNASPTAINDNAQFTLLWANRASRIGYVDFTLTTEGTGSDSAGAVVADIRIPFVCAAGSKALYGRLEAKAAYTPGSGESFFIELTLEQN
jgi:hypothetical protein